MQFQGRFGGLKRFLLLRRSAGRGKKRFQAVSEGEKINGKFVRTEIKKSTRNSDALFV